MLNLFKSKKNLDLAIIIYEKHLQTPGLNDYPNRYLLPVSPRFRSIDFAIASLVSINLKKIVVLTSEGKETLTNYLFNNWPRQNFMVFDRVDLENEFTNFFYDYTAQNSVELISIIRGDLPVWFNLNGLKEKLQKEKAVTLKGQLTDQTMTLSMIIEKQLFANKIMPVLSQGVENFSLSIAEEDLHSHSLKMRGFIQPFKTFKEYVNFHMDLLENYFMLDHLNTLVPICPNSPIAGVGLIQEDGHVINSLIGENTQIRGRVENSVIFPEVKIDKGCVIKDSVILPGNSIGRNAKVTKTLIQEYFYETIIPNIGEQSEIGKQVCITPNKQFPDELNFGYTLIGQNANIPPRSIIGGNAYFASNQKAPSKKIPVRVSDGGNYPVSK